MEQSLAMNILEDYKKINKRLVIIIITILIMWLITIGYLVYVLNDIGTEEITETTTQEINDIDSIENSTITNGEYNGYSNYGNYGNYGRRGYDRKYRGYGYLDEMAEQYGRYQEGKERYGAGEETDKSFHYMVKALEDFIKVLNEEADNPQQKQQLMETLQNSMR